MANISFGQQMNLSFMSFQTNGKGTGNTISEIAKSVVKSKNDAFVASRNANQRALITLPEIIYSDGRGNVMKMGARNGSGEPASKMYAPLERKQYASSGWQEWEGLADGRGKAKGSAGFTVDAEVNDPAEAEEPADDQTAANLRQAVQIKKQMGIKASDGSLESLARDLAVFGLDFTALEGDNPETLVEEVRTRTLNMLDKLANSNGSVDERNRVTGASARLVNGIQSSAGAFFKVDTTTEVEVDGATINGDAAYSVGSVVVDPLVLDLAGDGIHLSSAEEGVEFDMDADGVKTKMGFIQGDDALLFIDKYGDSLVRDGDQLFGNNDGHANGFEKLASYDDNADGVIDRNDAIWDSLQVWVEKTADGVSEDSETMSLEEAGIESINVAYEDVRIDDGKGNLIGQTGDFKRADGTMGLAADAWLQEMRVRQ